MQLDEEVYGRASGHLGSPWGSRWPRRGTVAGDGELREVARFEQERMYEGARGGGSDAGGSARLLGERMRPRWPGSREASRWQRRRALAPVCYFGVRGRRDKKRVGWAELVGWGKTSWAEARGCSPFLFLLFLLFVFLW